MELQRRGTQRIRRGYAEDVYPELSRQIIGAAMKVHSALGPGLLEAAYETCLCHELARRDLRFARQVPMPIRFENFNLECGFRIDLAVEDKVIVELKSVDHILPVHHSQLLTYLKLSGLPLGLLINFNVAHLRNGISRRVLTPV